MRPRTPTMAALRVLLAGLLLGLSELAMGLSGWLQDLSIRVERPARRPQRGLVRIGVLAILSGIGLAAGTGWAARGTEERLGVEAGRPSASRETSAAIVEGIARGCASAGRDVVAGVHEGVFVIRCRQPVENLGWMPPPPKGRR